MQFLEAYVLWVEVECDFPGECGRMSLLGLCEVNDEAAKVLPVRGPSHDLLLVR